MAVLISEILKEVTAKIASFAEVNVTLGSPVDSEPGLYVFAYMFSKDSNFRKVPINSKEGITNQRYLLSCLLLSSLPNDYEGCHVIYRCKIS